MADRVIPAPAAFTAGAGHFIARSDTAVAHQGPEAAGLVESFCTEVQHRTGLRLRPEDASGIRPQPHIRVELGPAREAGHLPPPSGLPPDGGPPADERHSITMEPDQVVVRAAEPVGLRRGLTTLLQLLATADSSGTNEIALPCGRLVDGPRFAWRGLSLDVARTFFTPAEVRRVIDLLALYKLNVLHLHLTDDLGWRLPFGRNEEPTAAASHYTEADLAALVTYAQERFVTLVPEVDTPGHALALLELHPELDTGRNRIAFDHPLGNTHHAVWLDPDLPATLDLIEDVMAATAATFPGPYLHLGGDEPYGMPHDLYARYVRRLRAYVRSLGKQPLGWQETARAGLGGADVIQYWLTDIALADRLPTEVRAQMDVDVALSHRDLEAAVAAGVRVIASPLSHCYLDVPYAEPPVDPAQAATRARLGLDLYAPMTVAESFDWDPAEVLGAGRDEHVAGIEAASWGETVRDFDDLAFLLLPRLPGVAQKAWGASASVTWAEHRDRLGWHGRLWEHDGLTFFRSSAVPWH